MRMTDLPQGIQWKALGLDPSRIEQVERIQNRDGRFLVRLLFAGEAVILKWSEDSASATEVKNYRLLQRHGVPTLAVRAMTENAIVLPDLTRDLEWRLARESDMALAGTGVALARWYWRFHEARRRALAQGDNACDHLAREADCLTKDAVALTGHRLGLDSIPAWRRACAHVERLRRAVESLPRTFSYNDFFWGNVAVSREGSELRAIVFDYHLMGVGPKESDCRNVRGSLGSKAAHAFQEAYGPLDERAVALDAPTAVLCALNVAAEKPRLPPWAQGLVKSVASGAFEGQLDRALAVIE
jgi:hypothetical protein